MDRDRVEGAVGAQRALGVDLVADRDAGKGASLLALDLVGRRTGDVVTSPPTCGSLTLTAVAVKVPPLTVPWASMSLPTTTSEFEPAFGPTV